jgi:hypothetical protein
MGFFKNMGELQKMGREAQKNMDVGAQMANAQTRMAQAQAMMAQQTAAASIAGTGIDATATVVAVRQAQGGPLVIAQGQMVNTQTMEVDLTVFPPSGAPYPVTVSQPVAPNLAGRLVPGGSLRVKIDPQNQQALWIDPTS